MLRCTWQVKVKLCLLLANTEAENRMIRADRLKMHKRLPELPAETTDSESAVTPRTSSSILQHLRHFPPSCHEALTKRFTGLGPLRPLSKGRIWLRAICCLPKIACQGAEGFLLDDVTSKQKGHSEFACHEPLQGFARLGKKGLEIGRAQ